jgi:hypothetical protein
VDPLTFAKLWLLVKPIYRIRLALARRRARKAGRPEPNWIPEEDVVFPKGKMTKSGVIISLLGPLLTLGLTIAGFAECSPEQVAEGCVGASEASMAIIAGIGGTVTAIGGLIAWRGRNRVVEKL